MPEPSTSLRPFFYKRFPTREVFVGRVALGASNPIRIQSMVSAPTMETEAVVRECLDLDRVGCEIVRITARDMKEAENLGRIRERLLQNGSSVPLVADIHFSPRAAMIAVEHVEKVRINPGNFVDRKKFETHLYSDAEYNEELERIEESFLPLLGRARELKRALRIGVNHGSLSDRIMSRYGDTTDGMVESAMEFLRIARKYDFHSLVVSMKSSNPKVMVEAYRLLVERFREESMDYPLHLGVTEAGDGRDGRIRSAIGIGSLLEEGIGDTIRVSLTEDSVLEIPVARTIASRFDRRPPDPLPVDAKSLEEALFAHPVRMAATENQESLSPGGAPPVLLALDLNLLPPGGGAIEKASPAFPGDLEGEWERAALELATGGADWLVLTGHGPRNEAGWDAYRSALARFPHERIRNALKGEEREIAFFVELPPGIERDGNRGLPGEILEAASFADGLLVPIAIGDNTTSAHPEQIFSAIAGAGWRGRLLVSLRFAGQETGKTLLEADFVRNLDALLERLPSGAALLVDSPPPLSPGLTRLYRILSTRLRHLQLRNPVLLAVTVRDPGDLLYEASIHAGGLFLEGIGEGLFLKTESPSPGAGRLQLGLDLLQAVRLRINRADFISCPSCGRTQFDLQKVAREIKERLSHLKGVKIGIMGCIVNGPGEMADADFGYVGAGPDRVHLYRRQQAVKKNLPANTAVEELVQLIKSEGLWVEAPDRPVPSNGDEFTGS